MGKLKHRLGKRLVKLHILVSVFISVGKMVSNDAIISVAGSYKNVYFLFYVVLLS